MVTITGLAQGGNWRTSKYLFVNTAREGGGETKHLTLSVQEQLFFSKLKPQHLGFNCSIGTLK